MFVSFLEVWGRFSTACGRSVSTLKALDTNYNRIKSETVCVLGAD
jgi:hypothetical protein